MYDARWVRMCCRATSEGQRPWLCLRNSVCAHALLLDVHPQVPPSSVPFVRPQTRNLH